MIFPDINLLVYAHNIHARQHEMARDWWNACLSGNTGVALAWVVILGFIRVTTHPKVFPNPMTAEGALGRVAEWLSLPHVQLIQPGPSHFLHLQRLMSNVGSAGNLTTDAHLAALAIERGLVVQTTDADFARFSGLKWRNPLAAPAARTHQPAVQGRRSE